MSHQTFVVSNCVPFYYWKICHWYYFSRLIIPDHRIYQILKIKKPRRWTCSFVIKRIHEANYLTMYGTGIYWHTYRWVREIKQFYIEKKTMNTGNSSNVIDERNEVLHAFKKLDYPTRLILCNAGFIQIWNHLDGQNLSFFLFYWNPLMTNLPSIWTTVGFSISELKFIINKVFYRWTPLNIKNVPF